MRAGMALDEVRRGVDGCGARFGRGVARGDCFVN